jgi:hypothetical protein
MNEILDIFNPQVHQSGDTVSVLYEYQSFSGSCIYQEHTMKGTNKPIYQRFFILTDCEMGDVIEYIHKTSPLSSEDFQKVNLTIREHSLSTLNKELKTGSLI